MSDRRTAGRFGCVLCDEPPPHSHDLGMILNARYYCADGSEHQWAPRTRRRRPRCLNCGEKAMRDRSPADWHRRSARFGRWMRDHYWLIPSIDGMLVFAAFLAILCGLAVLLSMLLGEFGMGPLAGWWHARH